MAALLLLQKETWTVSVVKLYRNLKQTNKQKFQQVSVSSVSCNPLGINMVQKHLPESDE